MVLSPKRWLSEGYSDKSDEKMFMQVYCRLPSGKATTLKVLIDTGCEVNLVREGVLPREEFGLANRRLNLTTANSQPMRGGDKIISTKLIFTRNMADLGKGDFGIDTDFYEADINVDAILGCPWTKRNRLGIFPYLDALSLERGGVNWTSSKTVPPS